MSKVIKQMEMEALKQRFHGVRDMVFLSTVGVDSNTDNQMRQTLRKKKIFLSVVKNSLARRVFDEFGFKLTSTLAGQTTVAYGAGSLSELSRELEALAKKNKKIEFKMALSEGQEVSFKAALAMPTRAEAVARVIGLALAPAMRVAGQIIAPAGNLASQIKTISEKVEAAAAEAVAEPAPAAAG